jgi:hypothetical protein
MKIIKKKEEVPRFSQIIEAKAGRIAESVKEKWGTAPFSAIEREIALTLNHIEGVNKVHSMLENELSKLQMYFDTKIMQIWPGMIEHVPYLNREQDRQKIKEKEKLQDKLLNLDEERRKLLVSLEEKLQPLHDRLLQLLQKQVLLEDDNGHREDSS